MTVSNADLYNCCTGFQEPDWSLFCGLELGGCVTEKMPNGDEFTIGGISRDKAEFFTVYGRLKEGGCDAITDADTLERAVTIMRRFEGRTGLQGSIDC